MDMGKLIKDLESSAVEIEQEKAKAEAIFTGIGDGAIVTDEKGNIIRVNLVARSMLGFDEQELVGMWYPKTIVAVDKKNKQISPINRPMTKALIEGSPVSEKTYYVKKDGSTLPVFVTISPILLDEKPIGAIEIFRDITHEMEIDRMKTEFIGLASHQLRTPLTAIMLYSNMLSQGYAGELNKEQKEYANIIGHSTNRMIELVNILLNISRIEAGRLAITPQVTNLTKLVDEIMAELGPKAEEKKIEVTVKTEQSIGKISTDPLLIKEVYANLISNAIKYTPEGGRVTIEIKKDGEYLTSTVKDNGYGIPFADNARVFTKFYRGDNIISKVPEGTGLGLYLIKSVVEACGGKIWFDSVENKGTAFYFSLPIAGIKAKEGTQTFEK